MSSKVGLISGCFDGFHPGHIYILSIISKKCDIVHVSLNDDNYIRNYKGREPIFNQDQRKGVLLNSCLVDFVHIFSNETPIDIIKTIKPDIIFVGDDYEVDSVVGREEILKWGGKIEIIKRLPGYSSTQLYQTISKKE